MTDRGEQPATSSATSSGREGVARVARLVWLGAALARRGVATTAALVVAILTVVLFVVLALALAVRGGDAPVHDVPILASSALAWGAGFLIAVAVAMNCFARDRADGIRDLFVLRAGSSNAYLTARLGGLAAVLILVVGGGTVICGTCAILGAVRVGVVLRTFQATVASVVFAIAFAAIVAPLAFVSLASRSRLRGYGLLLALLVLPEILAAGLRDVLPAEITDVLAIPSALAALRAGLAPHTASLFRVVRALVALGVFGAVFAFVLRRDVRAIMRRGAA